MKGILLRGLIEVMYYAVTLPLRFIILIVAICYIAYVSIKYELSFMGLMNVFVTGVKDSFLNEITWVKTNKCKSFDELMSEEES